MVSAFLWHTICLCIWQLHIGMTDLDFIRLSALVFATRLIGEDPEPIGRAVDLAEELFNKLKEKEG